MDQAEASGKTVDDALSRALRSIGATRADLDAERVEMTVLDEGRRGMFGMGSREARVLVKRVGAAAPAQNGERSGGRSRGGRDEQQEQPAQNGQEKEGRRRGRRGRGGAGERPASEQRSGTGRSRGRNGGGSRRGRGGRSFETAERKLTEADFLRPPRFDEETGEAPAEEAVPAARGERRRGRRGGNGDQAPRGERRERGDRGRHRDEQEVTPDINAEEVELAATVVDDLLRMVGVEAELTIREPLTAGDGLGMVRAVIDITGDDLGLLIGRRGETLLSLQYLVNLIVTRRYPGQGGVTLDAEHYRHRRETQIVALAERMADRVRQTGSAITLEPMSAAERRLVHLALADDPELVTNSVGEGENRKVVISTRH
ncbi:MAG: Jag N-terminal domain-containing protein [Dehalococcoidia bacterium]|nr:Jag N-terminal domain-containing protein [Dehalococcoidia bacterium]